MATTSPEPPVDRPLKAVASNTTARGPPQAATDLFVVGVGASAGGLEACKKVFAALPANSGMAFILVQHLDPTHESMMVDLLAGDTSLTVEQAIEGALVQPDHLYIIPPGTYLSVSAGTLHLSKPAARHGARLPFDFLLHSLAKDYGPHAMAVVLSGTGADGSGGLRSIKEHCGMVIAQDPKDASFDGMPQNAILTGHVDRVLPAADIAEALLAYRRRAATHRISEFQGDAEAAASWLPDIIDFLRVKTGHDFSLYKQGTLRRRIERRMAMASIDPADANAYLELLEADPAERDRLAKDLLINVTNFFRDPKVFDTLAKAVIPAIVEAAGVERSIRMWVAGCSTGEEAYSLVMQFREALAEHKSSVSLHVFASDIDADAVAVARAGLYPETIATDVSPERLSRFFMKEERGYRVRPDLRSAIVFSVQDLLTDPPFSRLNMISCRNLMIYLGPEAQSRAIALFHFALRGDGILLLGSAETAGSIDGRFHVVAKAERIYRRIGSTLPAPISKGIAPGEAGRVLGGLLGAPTGVRPSALADLCRRTVAETFGPAAVLINSKREYLYATGPVDQYVRLPTGYQTNDILAMLPYEWRAKVTAAIDEVLHGADGIQIPNVGFNRDADGQTFDIHVLPVPGQREPLLLVCFVAGVAPDVAGPAGLEGADTPRSALLEEQNTSLRRDLKNAVSSLEIATEEQRLIDEEVLSVNEEYQSTNEELVTSKEELQSLNEELTALNSQLQETLERQRTTSDDLKNILYSTDVATIFLDTRLNIRFFTPATKLIFNIIPSDIGRPLADLSLLASDGSLLGDAEGVLRTHDPVEREVEFTGAHWYIRRILPYREENNRVGGVVITFSDITDRKHIAKALEAAKLEAEIATVAKSRFLAVASHDLRQPLQTLALLQGLLARRVENEQARKLVVRVGETLSSMSDMLNTLLDLNQIDSGTIVPKFVDFTVNDILHPMQEEFAYHAKAMGLSLNIVPCGLTAHSDPRLLEQILRNLLTNALKYTECGAVLLGCRRRGDQLHIEIWDTGIGIPEAEQSSIFGEYYQVNNPTRLHTRGLGLGLSIVKRLSDLLGHKVEVRSRPGHGSVFSIVVPLVPSHTILDGPASTINAPVPTECWPATILVVEDDTQVGALLGEALNEAGFLTTMAPDGPAALACLETLGGGPDLVLADYNLPHGRNGLQVIADVRARLGRNVPAIILTGDITSGALREIAETKCAILNKPVKSHELISALKLVLANGGGPAAVQETEPSSALNSSGTVIFIVDDDRSIRTALRDILETDERCVEDFTTCEAFLASYRPGREACLLIDAYLPGMSGLQLLERLQSWGDQLPAIMITGRSDVQIAVNAMKAGAVDFIEKPFLPAELSESVERALLLSRDVNQRAMWKATACDQISSLTPRQRQIMDMVLSGQPSKNIAADLGISQRTVENHRASIMQRTGAGSLPALARLVLAASSVQRDNADARSRTKP